MSARSQDGTSNMIDEEAMTGGPTKGLGKYLKLLIIRSYVRSHADIVSYWVRLVSMPLSNPSRDLR